MKGPSTVSPSLRLTALACIATATVFSLSACAPSSPRDSELAAQDHRIRTLRESIRMERAHLDSFPNDTASIRNIGHLIEEEEIAQNIRQGMVQPPLDAKEKQDAANAESRRQFEVIRTKNP
jgi:hypothetical protein